MGARPDDEATAQWRQAKSEPGEPATIPATPPKQEGVTQPPSPASNAAADLDATGLPARFAPISMLGRGGMGRVLRVHDRSLNREVAVKIVRAHQDEHSRLRFLREARAAGTLRHPNIVTVHDVAPEGEYLVMELVQGESLAGVLKRVGKLPVDEVRRIGASLLDALGAAHRAGIIHRDIKPANILIDPDGVVKLTDFGIASFGDSELTSTGQLIGTPAYMAPEQLRARSVDERADVYGAGATLFEAATGLVLNSKHATVEDPRQAILDATGDDALASAITKAVRDKEAERFADAATFAEALARTVARPATETRVPAPAPASTPAPVPTRRRWLVAGAAFAITAGIAAAVGSRALHHHSAAGPVAARETTIAILPFENHVTDPRLDFASSGLAHLLGEQLGYIDHLHVLGYYRIRASVKNRDDLAEWREAALKLGANMIVRGELEPVGDLARVSIMIERGDGSSLDRVAREVPIDQVPETVRTLAAAVATTALGAPTRGSPAITRAFDVERELQLGVAAFERQEFDAARGHLTAAVVRDPALAEAYYHLALLDWWQGMEPQAHIRLALGGSLGKNAREFLVGLKLLWDQDYPRAVDYFRDLARRAPDQRDVQYGLFEALYHGGHATEAIETYRRLRDLAPGFYVGVEHAMSYYLARGDVAGIRWTREHWDVPVAETARWDARAKMAEQDYPEAIKILERAQEEDPGAQSSIARDLVAAYAVTGQLALARELTARLAGDAGFRTLASYGLAVAGGEDGAIWRKEAWPAGRTIAGIKPWENWFDLVSLDLVVAQPPTLREDLEVYAKTEGHVPMVEIGLMMLAQRLGQPREPSDPRVKVFPQAVAAATAIVADTRRNAKAAAEAWRQVIELDDDGRSALHARTALALDLAALGDHAGVIATCSDVITPRAFTWAWASGVGPCLRASAEAATALGRSDEARRYWQRLLALRSRAPTDDELVRAARAGLAR